MDRCCEGDTVRVWGLVKAEVLLGGSREGSLEEVHQGPLTGSSWKGGCFESVEWHKKNAGERKHSRQLWKPNSLG